MNLHGSLRSWSGRAIVFVALAAAYYLALNAVFIHELVEQVQAGPRTPAVEPRMQEPETREIAVCGDLGRIDREICRAESAITKASNTLREHRRERRAVAQAR